MGKMLFLKGQHTRRKKYGWLFTVKIYDDLNMADLSEKLATNRTYTSSIINDYYGVNFKQLINSYRVKHSFQYLDDPNCSLSISEIAIACGFNSYQTFNRSFQKEEMLTPKQYLSKKRK